MQQPSLLSVLRERAGLQPQDPAFTYTDYEQDWAGVAETLTWSQLYRRVCNVAHELRSHGKPGDRAVIVAPQGLDYVVGFLGAIQAGLIAVPLNVPQPGGHDERTNAVLADTEPTILLTTTAATGTVSECVRPLNGHGPAIVEIDTLDLDARTGSSALPRDLPEIAYLQYTSGSTRTPAGAMITHANLHTNWQQVMANFFADCPGGIAPPDTTLVSWLPLYHDMGLIKGVVAPILGGYRCEMTSPIAFLQRPARWMQSVARATNAWSAAPNFAFDLAIRRTSDEDMAGLDLSGVLGLVSGSERVHPATLKRFTERFAKFNFREDMLRPTYGLAEATLFVAARFVSGEAPQVARFDAEKLAKGSARRCEDATGSPLLSYGMPAAPTVRIVDPDNFGECPSGSVGEIWVQGPNVAAGYWSKPEETQHTFGATIANPLPGTPDGPWLRTGDLGFVSDDELFIVGRLKDLLIVYGRNHYAEDIEATVREITGGRVAAIAVPVDHTEKLVTIIEFKKRADADPDSDPRALLHGVKNDVTAAVANSHGLNLADCVLVPPGSIPTTTSGKIRRASCVEQYRQSQFTRLDA
ncbi:AMP-binding protein [Mycolicibacterium palauense]|uniref:AMP-binding protein n=1 Tax=Mycolicibacterium palauense TaxID=2034511 RepID=UPI000BFECFAD|nr:AMP-binding protein [Mycolicibacterium palauense]